MTSWADSCPTHGCRTAARCRPRSRSGRAPRTLVRSGVHRLDVGQDVPLHPARRGGGDSRRGGPGRCRLVVPVDARLGPCGVVPKRLERPAADRRLVVEPQRRARHRAARRQRRQVELDDRAGVVGGTLRGDLEDAVGAEVRGRRRLIQPRVRARCDRLAAAHGAAAAGVLHGHVVIGGAARVDGRCPCRPGSRWPGAAGCRCSCSRCSPRTASCRRSRQRCGDGPPARCPCRSPGRCR